MSARRRLRAAALIAVALLTAGCTATSDYGTPTPTTSATPSPTPTAAPRVLTQAGERTLTCTDDIGDTTAPNWAPGFDITVVRLSAPGTDLSIQMAADPYVDLESFDLGIRLSNRGEGHGAESSVTINTKLGSDGKGFVEIEGGLGGRERVQSSISGQTNDIIVIVPRTTIEARGVYLDDFQWSAHLTVNLNMGDSCPNEGTLLGSL